MKIAIVGPPYIPIPPPRYGGTELVIHNLTLGLTRLGHEVFLFGVRGSAAPATKFIPYIESQQADFSLDSHLNVKNITAELSAKFAYSMGAYLGAEIIHDHTLSNNFIDKPAVYTLHGPATEGAVDMCVKLSGNPVNGFVSISGRQPEMFLTLSKNINFAGTVHNSVDIQKIGWDENKEDFLLFVGRINWEKGPDLAIRVAAKAKKPLVMVVKMSEQFEKDFFSQEIQPLLDEFPKGLTFKLYEEPPHDFKFQLYRKAKCTLFTSQWEEPFGLVMIESMACGTPVVALRRGAAPEVIADGKTGFLVDSEQEMVEAVKNIDKIDPAVCRKHVERNFSVEKMAENYIKVYGKVIGEAP
jgi:glycosyltransferase involved in cell wall biosynthesis